MSRHPPASSHWNFCVKAPQPTSRPPATARLDLVGVLCGTGAALFWAIGFVAARHGIAAGFSPVDIVLHRFVWAGLLFLPVVDREGLGKLGGVGLARGVALALVGGAPLAEVS